jgi:hypothetical protein
MMILVSTAGFTGGNFGHKWLGSHGNFLVEPVSAAPTVPTGDILNEDGTTITNEDGTAISNE